MTASSNPEYALLGRRLSRQMWLAATFASAGLVLGSALILWFRSPGLWHDRGRHTANFFAEVSATFFYLALLSAVMVSIYYPIHRYLASVSPRNVTSLIRDSSALTFIRAAFPVPKATPFYSAAWLAIIFTGIPLNLALIFVLYVVDPGAISRDWGIGAKGFDVSFFLPLALYLPSQQIGATHVSALLQGFPLRSPSLASERSSLVATLISSMLVLSYSILSLLIGAGVVLFSAWSWSGLALGLVCVTFAFSVLTAATCRLIVRFYSASRES